MKKDKPKQKAVAKKQQQKPSKKEETISLAQYIKTMKTIVSPTDPANFAASSADAVILQQAGVYKTLHTFFKNVELATDDALVSELNQAAIQLGIRDVSLRKLIKSKVLPRKVADALSARMKLPQNAAAIENGRLIRPKMLLLSVFLADLEKAIPTIKTVEEACQCWGEFYENVENVAVSIFATESSIYQLLANYPEIDLRVIRLLDKVREVKETTFCITPGKYFLRPENEAGKNVKKCGKKEKCCKKEEKKKPCCCKEKKPCKCEEKKACECSHKEVKKEKTKKSTK